MDLYDGVVIRGDGRGRALGFPTANMELVEMGLEEGIWAAWCQLAGRNEWRKGALHVGPRPTYGDDRLSVELYILNFPDRDLYGEEITFQPIQRIRGVESFGSEEELVAAIEADCLEVERVLQTPPNSVG